MAVNTKLFTRIFSETFCVCPPAPTVRYTGVHKHSGCINHFYIHDCSKCPVCHQVRSKAQSVLFTALGTYNFCCRDITPRVLELLEPARTNVTQQQFKVQRNPELYIFHEWYRFLCDGVGIHLDII